MIGKVLSHYQFLELAGRGGMGEVYKALDQRLRRPVAVKILPPDLADDPRRRSRLFREARTVALPNHPGIVSVFDVGTDRGIDFVVMEWVEGRTLQEEIEHGSLPYSRAVEYGAHLAEAMAAAHAAGVVHRDLKPRNVMIDQAGRIRVLDFGIAQVESLLDRDTRGPTEDDLTESGATPGTFAYMSPEQILGEKIDRASDVFSLGVVLYQMLTGRRPFAAENLATLVHQVVFDEPTPPSEAAPAVPPEIDEVVSRAVAKSPPDRPDMETLAAELRKLVGLPEISTTGHDVRSLKATRNHRRLAFRFLVAVLAALLVAATVALWSRAPGDESMSELMSTPEMLPESPYELYTRGLRFLERYDREGYIDQAVEYFEAAIKQRGDYAPAHSGLARAYWRQYRLRADPVWLHRAEASARRALELAPQLSHPRVGLALIQILQGELDQARSELESLGRLDPINPDVLSARAELASTEGRYADATSLYREALQESPGNWELLMLLGIAEAQRGDLKTAEAALVESTEKVPDNAFAQRNLAAIYHFQGRYEAAVSALQASLDIRPTSSAYSNLGTLYFFLGQYGEAVSAFVSARRLGANNYLLWANLGDAYRQIAGREKEAEESFRRALQLLQSELGADPPEARARSRRALLQAKLGKVELALEDLALLQPLDEQAADTCFRATLTYELVGRRDRALSALELAFGKGHPPEEIRKEPELTQLREDVRFHRIAMHFEPDPVEDQSPEP